MTSPFRRIKPVTGTEGKDLGDEYLFYDRDHDHVHVLNGTAREIYLLCDGNRREAEIAAALAQRYDIDEETARGDTVRVIEELIRLGLVEAA